MKLTQEIKKQIDSYSEGKLRSMFRFFPSDITTGESGRYIQDRARYMSESDRSSSESRSSKGSLGSSPKSL